MSKGSNPVKSDPTFDKINLSFKIQIMIACSFILKRVLIKKDHITAMHSVSPKANGLSGCYLNNYY